MFDGKFKIKKVVDNTIVMNGLEDETILRLKGTSSYAHNFACLSHHDEYTFTYSIPWHAIWKYQL